MNSIFITLLALLSLNTAYSFESNSPYARAKSALELNDLQLASHLLKEKVQSEQTETWKTEEIDLFFELCCRADDLDGMRRLWNLVQNKKEYSPSHDTLEKIAWAIIKKSSSAYHPKIRFESLIAGATSNDARGVQIICRLMLDPHESLSKTALEIAGYFPDECIQETAVHIIQSDTITYKIEAAKLLSSQKAPQAIPLISALMNDETLSEKDQILLSSLLAEAMDELPLDTIIAYTKDPKSPIRALSAAYTLKKPSKESLLAILPLLNDISVSVQKMTIITLGLWQELLPENQADLHIGLLKHLESSDTTMAGNAAFALLLSNNVSNQQKALDWFSKSITSNPSQEALIAATRLIQGGPKAIPLLKTLLHQKALDPICRLNIAVALLQVREELDLSSNIIEEIPTQQLLAIQEDSIFSWIAKTHLQHNPAIPRLPEATDLNVRLKLIALRCFANLNINRAELEKILHDRSWGVCAEALQFAASELEPSIEKIVQPLLSHETESIRIQAALLYAMINKSKEAATILAQEYEKASKDGKESIIMGFALLPSSCSLPYITPLLFDSSLSLRTRAAGALLSSLYK